MELTLWATVRVRSEDAMVIGTALPETSTITGDAVSVAVSVTVSVTVSASEGDEYGKKEGEQADLHDGDWGVMYCYAGEREAKWCMRTGLSTREV